jgi:hypothetical protein
MLNLKKSSFFLAVATLAVTTGALFSTTAQAAIMGGQISGTWQYDGDGEGGFKAGDAFTADFTYDSDSIITTDRSNYYYELRRDRRNGKYYRSFYYNKYLTRSVPLLSLVFNSGTISQIFDFSSGDIGYLRWEDVQGNPGAGYGQFGYEESRLDAYDNTYDSSTALGSFRAYNRSGQDYYGSPSSSSYAWVSSNAPTYSVRAQTNSNVTFSDLFLVPPSEPTVSTPEPTSALLTGLIGLGVMVLHRRKKIEAAAE